MLEPFCIMLGRFDLESWWRGQRLFGVTHLGMENAGQDQRYLLEGKMRAHWGFEKVTDFGWQ